MAKTWSIDTAKRLYRASIAYKVNSGLGGYRIMTQGIDKLASHGRSNDKVISACFNFANCVVENAVKPDTKTAERLEGAQEWLKETINNARNANKTPNPVMLKMRETVGADEISDPVTLPTVIQGWREHIEGALQKTPPETSPRSKPTIEQLSRRGPDTEDAYADAIREGVRYAAAVALLGHTNIPKPDALNEMCRTGTTDNPLLSAIFAFADVVLENEFKPSGETTIKLNETRKTLSTALEQAGLAATKTNLLDAIEIQASEMAESGNPNPKRRKR